MSEDQGFGFNQDDDNPSGQHDLSTSNELNEPNEPNEPGEPGDPGEGTSVGNPPG